jgi:hypothetical protein
MACGLDGKAAEKICAAGKAAKFALSQRTRRRAASVCFVKKRARFNTTTSHPLNFDF